jgi:hypothetical protein
MRDYKDQDQLARLHTFMDEQQMFKWVWHKFKYFLSFFYLAFSVLAWVLI